MRRSLLVAVFLAGLVLVIGNIALTTAAQSQYGGTITEALGSEPTTMNIFEGTRRPEQAVLNLIHEPLFIMNKQLTPEPLLVDSWEASEDGLTWTFVIKQGIEFHDGTPLNAEAVAFSINRHLSGTHAYMLGDLKEAVAQDEYTVVFNFEEPYPELLTYLANYWIGMVSPQAVEELGEDYGVKDIVGTGPFVFKEWISGDRIILEKNQDYNHGPAFLSNQGPAYVEQWVFRSIVEPFTLIAELEEGDVDCTTYIPEDAHDQVADNPNLELATKPAPSSIHLAINTSPDNPPYDDARVREAIAHAVNRDAVILAALFGVAAPLYSLAPPGVLGYWEEGTDLAYQYTNYDPETSRSLLKEAGWIDTDGDGVCEKNGEKLDLVFFAFNIARYRRIAEVVEPMLEEVGFNVQIMVLEPGDLYERVIRGEHDLLSTAWMGIGLAQDLLFPTCHSDYLGTKTNWFLFSNAEFDAAMSLSLSALDDTERRQAVYKAQEVVIKAALCAPVASPLDMFGYKQRIGGVDEYMEHPWAFARDDAIRALLLYIK